LQLVAHCNAGQLKLLTDFFVACRITVRALLPPATSAAAAGKVPQHNQRATRFGGVGNIPSAAAPFGLPFALDGTAETGVVDVVANAAALGASEFDRLIAAINASSRGSAAQSCVFSAGGAASGAGASGVDAWVASEGLRQRAVFAPPPVLLNVPPICRVGMRDGLTRFVDAADLVADGHLLSRLSASSADVASMGNTSTIDQFASSVIREEVEAAAGAESAWFLQLRTVNAVATDAASAFVGLGHHVKEDMPTPVMPPSSAALLHAAFCYIRYANRTAPASLCRRLAVLAELIAIIRDLGSTSAGPNPVGLTPLRCQRRRMVTIDPTDCAIAIFLVDASWYQVHGARLLPADAPDIFLNVQRAVWLGPRDGGCGPHVLAALLPPSQCVVADAGADACHFGRAPATPTAVSETRATAWGEPVACDGVEGPIRCGFARAAATIADAAAPAVASGVEWLLRNLSGARLPSDAADPNSV
jgi:hypothetical protein